MSAKAKDDNSTGFDLQTKLLGGAVIGLGVGLIGLFLWTFIWRQKSFPWVVMGIFILAKYSHWVVNAHNDF